MKAPIGSSGLGRLRTAAGVFELDDPVALQTERLATRIREVFAQPGYRPPLPPPVAAEILSMATQNAISAQLIAEKLGQDPLLTDAVLRIAASPRYAGTAALVSIHDAVVRLGLSLLRDVVFEASLSLRVFRSTRYATWLSLLRRHSVAVANLGRMVCRFTALDANNAFLCGLMHDVGIAAALIALEDDALAASAPPDVVAGAVASVHEAAAGLVSAGWAVAPDLRLVLENHHHREIAGYVHPLVAVLAIADHLAAEGGFSLTVASVFSLETDSPVLLDATWAYAALGLRKEQRTLIESNARTLLVDLNP